MRTLGAVVAATLILAGCSTSSDSATGPLGTPGAPLTIVITAGNASVSIAFSQPASAGDSFITTYIATCTAAGVSHTGTAASSPIVVSGLTNGTEYSCSVRAVNSVGPGPASVAVLVTPRAATAGTT